MLTPFRVEYSQASRHDTGPLRGVNQSNRLTDRSQPKAFRPTRACNHIGCLRKERQKTDLGAGDLFNPANSSGSSRPVAQSMLRLDYKWIAQRVKRSGARLSVTMKRPERESAPLERWMMFRIGGRPTAPRWRWPDGSTGGTVPGSFRVRYGDRRPVLFRSSRSIRCEAFHLSPRRRRRPRSRAREPRTARRTCRSWGW